MKTRSIILAVILSCGLGAGIYTTFAYRQMVEAFENPVRFEPTRFFSDVAAISTGQSRQSIFKRLKRLRYRFEESSHLIQFTLREFNYPPQLIPDEDATRQLVGRSVTLEFSGDGPTATLLTISSDGEEFESFYLEPELIATLSSGGEDAIRKPLAFKKIPTLVWRAIMAIEDQHFLDHQGFDPRGIARAVLVNLKTLSFAQGGSTITQQLVKNLTARRTKNLFKKATELFLSILLEIKYPKTEIMTRYLNEVYLGQVGNLEVHGISQGAWHFFGKSIHELNLGEIALMAGIIRGPFYYSPYRHFDRAIERQKLVLKKMFETGQIAKAEMNDALKQEVRLAPPQNIRNLAPYFNDFVKAELIRTLEEEYTASEIVNMGLRVYTTLDVNLNQHAVHSIREGMKEIDSRYQIPKVSSRLRLETALASVDHQTGYIRVLIGGRSYSRSSFNRILNMKRQVGSTFKPIVYLSALLQGEDPLGVPYGGGYPMDVSPWKLIFDQGRQKWQPKNYDRIKENWLTMNESLARSINTGAARLGMQVGIENIVQTARSLGVTSELPEVPSLSLGVAELSPVELLKVYSHFANRGLQDDLTVIRLVTRHIDTHPGDDTPPEETVFGRYIYRPQQKVPAEPIDLLTQMLQGTFEFGTARSARLRGFELPAAGKTGTTSHYRDSWFAGFTPHYTTVVWVGLDKSFDDQNPIKLTGASAALPIWTRYMKLAHKDLPVTDFNHLESIQKLTIDRFTGQRATDDCPESQKAEGYYLYDYLPEEKTCARERPQLNRITEAQ